jgi:Polymerase beta, Nucleotidyltransferase
VRVSVPTDVVERLRAWAETKPEIRALWIFGSAITEKPNPSDLDIAFDADPRPDLNTFVNKVVSRWTAEIAPWCPYPPHLVSIGESLPGDKNEHVWDAMERGSIEVYSIAGYEVWSRRTSYD